MRNNETITVNAHAEEPQAAGFRLQDLYYALFRHKKKIIAFALLGLIGGASVFFSAKPTYVSEARLLVRYVIEGRAISPEESSAVRTLDPRGESIIQSEIELITSFDLVKDVVASVGATNIVLGSHDADPTAAALGIVGGGIQVDVSKHSNVLRISFRHSDPNIARLVLTNVVASYLKMHARVHRPTDALDDVARQVDQRRSSLEQTEAELRRLKEELGVVSLDDSKRSLLEQSAKIRGEILTTEAMLAEQRAALGPLTNALPTQTDIGTATSLPPESLPQEKINEYRAVLGRIETLTKHEQDLLVQFTSQSPRVRAVRDLLNEAKAERQQLEEKHPSLVQRVILSPNASRSGGASPVIDPLIALTPVRALEAKLATLNSQLAQLQTNALRLAEREAEITQLQRKKEIDEKQFLYYSTALDQARVDQTLNQGKIAGIRPLQEASPPTPDRSDHVKKAVVIAAGGLALGLALAFLLEMYVDQSIRRPVHVERNLRLPLFLSIPRLHLNNGRASRKALPAKTGPVPAGGSENGTPTGSPPGETSPAENSEIAPFAEALRDRLMMHFQLHGLDHKPKLVGVTSCGRGAGVTTLATSLAASLSETGDGNVLYVDVNQEFGPSVLPFQHGKRLPGIRDALEEGTRDATRVQENLYMVSLADPASGKVGIVPKTLAGLVPKMKASDYDYIIFDLPPITQTSATAKVAGLLDMTFVVLESEKTLGDLALKATGLLSESRANVAAVLNKHRRYLPSRVDTDL